MIANWITLSRVVIAPVFAYAFYHGVQVDYSRGWLWASVILLGLIELSDFLDGRVARHRKEVTDFGKVFDPLADSLSRLTIFVSFLAARVIPLWMFLIFLYRDVFIQGLRYMCLHRGVVVSARWSGKLKAGFQAVGSLGVVGVAVLQAYGVLREPASVYRHPGFYVMLLPAAFTAFSAVEYWLGNRQVLSKT